MSASAQASSVNASLLGPRNIMVSGQDFYKGPIYGMEWGVAFAFDHLGPDVDAAYKDRKNYKIEIIWSLNPGINRLNRHLTNDNRRLAVWDSEAMNKRMEIPESKFRLLFAEGKAMNSMEVEAIPGFTGQTVVALLPFGIPAPHLLDTLSHPLSNDIKKAGVYFDCKVDVTHVPTGTVLLKDHNLASGFNGIRVVSDDAREAKEGKHMERPNDLYQMFFYRALQMSDSQFFD